MKDEEIDEVIKCLLIDRFDISKSKFSWKIPLDQLDKDFKSLSYLVYLEQLLNFEFNTKLHIMEKINASIHTPTDIKNLINNKL